MYAIEDIYNQSQQLNRWFAQAITGLTPKRGIELYNSITRTATRKRVTAIGSIV